MGKIFLKTHPHLCIFTMTIGGMGDRHLATLPWGMAGDRLPAGLGGGGVCGIVHTSLGTRSLPPGCICPH